MRRTKEWWARLTKEERSTLVYLERASNRSSFARDGYLPDDCYECPGCSEPTMVAGLCGDCFDYMETLIEKADTEPPPEPVPVGRARIQLLRDIPVGKEHGLIAWMLLDADMFDKQGDRGAPQYRVISPGTGEPVFIMKHEAKFLYMLEWHDEEGSA